MKVFFSILAIYMMAVFLMPCADTFEKETFQHNDYSEQSQHSHDNSETKDFCSPFCLCNCCGTVSGVVFYWKISFSEIKTFELSKPNPQYISQFIPRYFGKIWQPPQINA
ncbi:DUF6660 family protein [Sphingobacterium cavernae]|uniref:DUF6660 family protein n=1 Tax=Sphingobacterium cavernae TaxID=2592657 RepID=UPI00122FEEF4|nr:DUF6660 family protein [Sphingobacterium cavernae]